MSLSGGTYSVLDDERINGRVRFYEGVSNAIQNSYAMAIGTVVPSDSEVEVYRDLGNVPSMSAWEGEAVFRELPNYKARLRNIPYHVGLRVNKDDIRRDKTGLIRTRMSNLGQQATLHWDELVDALILASETDGSATIGGEPDLASQTYDSQALFDTDHTHPGGTYTTSQSNDLTASDYSSLNVATAAEPTADELAKVITATLGHYYTLKDNEGRGVNGSARSFHFQVGTNQLFAPLVAALGLQNLTSGASNSAAGFIQSQGISVTAKLNPALAAKTTKIYSFRTDGGLRPFILQDEVGLAVEEEDPGMTSKDVLVQSTATRAAGFGDWTGAVLATLS